MRRHLFSVSLAAVGLFLLASDASACHNRKRACVCPPTPCVTTVVVQPQPVALVKPAKHGHRLAGLRGRIGGLHKARQACAPAPCATVQQSVVYSSVVYSATAPVDCATQACPTPQAPTKTTPVPPAKSAPVPPTKATPQEQG